MEYKKLLPAIVALLLIASVLSISTTGVSATHTPTVSIDKNNVKASTSMVLTITVQNAAGSDPIENVRVILPSVFTGLAPTVKVPKDNTVELAAPDNENVVLKAGTKVKLTGATTVTIPENTWLIRLANDNVFYENQAGTDSENLRLVDNVRIKKNATVNATGLTENDNVITVAQTTVSLNENDVVTLAETTVVRVSGNIVRLPENTLVKVHDDTNFRTTTADNVTTEKEKTVVLDNGRNWVTENAATVVVIKTGLQGTLPAGAWVRLWLAAGESDENRVVLPAGSKVRLAAGTTTVMLYENENKVLRVAPGATENIYLTDPASAENKPKNWEQRTGTSTLPSGPYVEWVGIADNQIAGGASLDFPFAVTTPSGTAYTIYVRTTDNKGMTVPKEITLTVDNVQPTVTVAASPLWVKDNVAVTITVKASETLAKLENVMVAENNAPENTKVTMSSTDNITWTGTYTTGDNKLRDGTARIYVVGAQFEDLVGNKGIDNNLGTFTVDRMAPPTPDLSAITGFPVDNAAAPGRQTKIGTWFIENIALDNFLGAFTVQEGMTVKIRVGTTVSDITTPASGYYSKSITLTEGKQEVGIQYVDKAGNVGKENAENVTYDATKPSFSMTSPAAGAMIKDNTPSIVLVITDAVMGVENAPFDPSDNSGYIVRLCRDDNTVIAQLTPKVSPTSAQFNSFTFENDYPSELSDNFYKIFVQAGDNLQFDNAYFRFEIDVKPPAAPTLTVQASQNPAAPDIKKTTTVSLGGTCEAYATVRIWTSSGPLFTPETVAEEVTDTEGDGAWSASITIPAGVTVWIRVSAVDRAGNEGPKASYGYLMADGTAPTVSITSPASGTKTDKASIEVKGTVTKDAWETWTDITLRVQIGLTSTTVPISAGSFSVNVALTEGTNTIIASVTDAVGNASSATITVERTVTPWGTYAIILVIVALILSAVAIFKKR